MATKTLVAMNKQGRLTVPVEARRALHVEGEAQFEVEVTENALILRPVVTIPQEDGSSTQPKASGCWSKRCKRCAKVGYCG